MDDRFEYPTEFAPRGGNRRRYDREAIARFHAELMADGEHTSGAALAATMQAFGCSPQTVYNAIHEFTTREE